MNKMTSKKILKYILVLIFLSICDYLKAQNLETKYESDYLTRLLSGGVIIYPKIDHAIFEEEKNGNLHYYIDSTCNSIITSKIDLDHRYIVDISFCSNGNIQIKYPKNTKRLIKEDTGEYYSVPDPQKGDDTAFYFSKNEVLKSKNKVLNFWLKSVLIDYGVKQYNIGKLQDVVYLSFYNIYQNCLINSLKAHMNVKTIETFQIIPFKEKKYSFQEMKLDSETLYYSKYKLKNSIAAEISLSIFSSFEENKNQSIRIQPKLIGFSYLERGRIIDGITFPLKTVYWTKRDLKKILSASEYEMLCEYSRLALYMQTTFYPCW